jgi:hypothetical protein
MEEPNGLGDAVAAGLNALGITEERVQKVASLVGVKKCKCKERREMLNRAGAAVKRMISGEKQPENPKEE